MIIFYCLTTFCNIEFFKYLPLVIFYLGLYSSFLLIKPSAVQYKLSISFCWGTCTLSFFFLFKAREHVRNQTVHMWIFIYLVSPGSSKVLWYQVPFRVFQKFWNIKYRHLKYYCRAKSDKSLLHFIEQWHRLSERVLLIKTCIEQHILLLLLPSKILVVLYCKIFKVFSSKLFSSF